jgi:hypothetical protein
MFAFVRFVARAFMRSSETTPPNDAGTPSSLAAIRGADLIAPFHGHISNECSGQAQQCNRYNHAPEECSK